MSPAGWIAFASGLVTIVSSLTCGWLGVSAYRAGKRGIGVTILVIPIVFTLGLPILAEVLPLPADAHGTMFRMHIEITGLVLTPLATLAALLTSRRYLPH
jgi:hypothetical protein